MFTPDSSLLPPWRRRHMVLDSSPASLSRTILSLAAEPVANQQSQLESISNLLFEGNCHFALSFNTSPKSYLAAYEALHWVCFNGEDPKLSLQARHEERELRCGEMWKGNHVAYRCSTCGISENSCMCVACFDEKDHVGHDYRIYSSTVGGCCDCGDEQAWRPSGFCSKHSRAAQPSNSADANLDPSILANSTIACTIVAFHLWRALHRLFQRGMTKPEDSSSPATFQVAHCLTFFAKLAGGSSTGGTRETRLGVCNAFSTRLSSTFGALANATSSTLYLDNFTMTEILLNVCCFLPHGLAKEAEMLLLKLMMEPSFKPHFQSDFVRFYPKFLRVLRESNQNTQPRTSPPQHVIRLRASLQVVYHATTSRELFESCCQILDGLYCQLFHNEEVSIAFAPKVLLAIFTVLNHEQAAIKYGFYSRCFSHMHSLLNFPAICQIVLENETLFTALLGMIKTAQASVPAVQNEADIFPFFLLLEDFCLAPLCKFAAHRVHGGLSDEVVQVRLGQLQSAVESLSKSGDGAPPGSIHIPLTRLYFRLGRLLGGTANAATCALLTPCLQALQEMFLFEHARNAGMGTYLASRYKRAFLPLDLRICYENFSLLAAATPECFTWQETEHGLRVLGALALMDQSEAETEEDALRRRLIHVLACKQPCAFSEIELAREDKEERVMQILEEIAQTSQSSSSSVATPKQFSLQRAVWSQVEFGGFYLAWTLKDEEQAMQAYRKEFKLLGEDCFPIANRFKPSYRATLAGKGSSSSRGIVQSSLVAQECDRVLRRARVGSEEDGNLLRCKTMALLLMCLREEGGGISESTAATWDVSGVCPSLVKFCLGQTTSDEQEEAQAAEEGGGGKRKRKEGAQNPAQAKAMRALAKRQREFALQMQATEQEAGEQQQQQQHETLVEKECCVLCKTSGEETLHLLLLRKSSVYAQNREAVYWQGQARGVALSSMEKEIATDASICGLSSSTSTTSNSVAFWQTRFFAKLQETRSRLNNTNFENTILHTCNHAVHESCLKTYRASLLARAAQRERFEGEGIIVPELGEVVCPVCRRVANDLMPLADTGKTFEPLAVRPAYEVWLAQRFGDDSSTGGDVKEEEPSKRNARFDAFVSRFDCLAELVVAQLDAIVATGATSALGPLLALCMENRKLGGSGWREFAKKRFGGGRESVLHTDLILVMVEWMFLDEQVDVERIFHFLLPFAKLQDLIFESLRARASARDYCSVFQDDALGEEVLALALTLLAAMQVTISTKPPPPSSAAYVQESEAIDAVVTAMLSQEQDLVAAGEMDKLISGWLPVDFFPTRSSAKRDETFEQRFVRLSERLTGQCFAQPPPPSAMLSSDLMQALLRDFLQQARQLRVESESDAAMVRCVALANSLQTWSLLPPVFSKQAGATLIKLPNEYSSLTVAFLGRQCICTKCGLKPDNPALCLSCGAMLCLRSTCCHLSPRATGAGAGAPLDEFLLDEVFTHANNTCGRGGKTSSSAFLMLKNGVVLIILSEARFILFGTLYLDAYGEEDLFLARGKPLLLNFDKLRQVEALQNSQLWFQDSRVVEQIRVLAFDRL